MAAQAQYYNIPVYAPNATRGDILRFKTLPEAVEFCSKTKDAKIAFDRIGSLLWREREATRLNEGVYTNLPLAFQRRLNVAIRNMGIGEVHYAHLSENKKGISFTATHEQGVMDRRTTMNAGRYLTKYYSDFFTASEIADLAGDFKAIDGDDVDFKIGMTRADFAFAYSNQPVNSPGTSHQSCMSRDFKHLPCHPAEVYAAGDLGIACLISKSDSNIVAARALCFPERKVHSYIYALSHRYERLLKKYLEDEGYAGTLNFSGAKLLRIPFDTHYVVMPYIDGCFRVETKDDDPNHLYLRTGVGRGSYADSTSGRIMI